MKKTAEEKWQAVVACINAKLEGRGHFEEDTEVGRWEFYWRGEDMVGYKCSVGLRANPDKPRTLLTDLLVGLDWESVKGIHTEQEVAALHNLLGLGRLDAVEQCEYRAEGMLHHQLRQSREHYTGLLEQERATTAKLLHGVRELLSRCHSDALRVEVENLVKAHEAGQSRLDAHVAELEVKLKGLPHA